MSKTSKPRAGSLQFSPRVRAKRIYGKLKVDRDSYESRSFSEVKFAGFAGYKVGMARVRMVENKKGSVNYGKKVVKPVTILEVPDLYVIGARSYKLTPYGFQVIDEVITSEGVEKYLKRKRSVPKEKKRGIEELNTEGATHIKAIVMTQPYLAGIGKKTPELFEVPILSPSLEEDLKFIKEYFGKTYSIENVFAPGMFVDTIGVTKGKGFQGSVKRWGVKIMKRGKTDKVARRVGNLGPWHPAKTSWRVPQHGQMGYHLRTEYNKMILKMGEASDGFVDKKGGWEHYGVVKSKYLILKGSVQGPPKRLILMREAIRKSRGEYDPPEVDRIYF